MATTSSLSSRMSTEAKNNSGLPWSTVEAAVEVLLGALGGRPIPAWDNRAFTYFGATNNIHTIVYKSGSTTVATQTFTYTGGGATDNDTVVSEVWT